MLVGVVRAWVPWARIVARLSPDLQRPWAPRTLFAWDGPKTAKRGTCQDLSTTSCGFLLSTVKTCFCSAFGGEHCGCYPDSGQARVLARQQAAERCSERLCHAVVRCTEGEGVYTSLLDGLRRLASMSIAAQILTRSSRVSRATVQASDMPAVRYSLDTKNDQEDLKSRSDTGSPVMSLDVHNAFAFVLLSRITSRSMAGLCISKPCRD